jgi:hypothetical protein
MVCRGRTLLFDWPTPRLSALENVGGTTCCRCVGGRSSTIFNGGDLRGDLTHWTTGDAVGSMRIDIFLNKLVEYSARHFAITQRYD